MKNLSIILTILLLTACSANRAKTVYMAPVEPEGSRYARYVTLAEALKSVGGLQVFTNPTETTILVRNINSINSDNQPLFVVDNTWRGRGYNVVSNLDPKTIKSIDVKKGLVATNQYGAQGNSGVIVIRTMSNSKK